MDWLERQYEVANRVWEDLRDYREHSERVWTAAKHLDRTRLEAGNGASVAEYRVAPDGLIYRELTGSNVPRGREPGVYDLPDNSPWWAQPGANAEAEKRFGVRFGAGNQPPSHLSCVCHQCTGNSRPTHGGSCF